MVLVFFLPDNAGNTVADIGEYCYIVSALHGNAGNTVANIGESYST